MASLNGVTIKNIKTFIGREGEGAQGTVYLNGEKLGFWSDDANGGCFRYDFNMKLLSEVVSQVKATLSGTICLVYNTDMFISDVLNLCLIEKDFKRLSKRGYPILVVGIASGCGFCTCAYRNEQSITEEDKEEMMNKVMVKKTDIQPECIVVKGLEDLEIVKAV